MLDTNNTTQQNTQQQNTQIYHGFALFFSNLKGFGFIEWYKNAEKQKDMFVHFSAIEMEGYKTLKKGDKVEFTIGKNNAGVPVAVNVKILK